MKPRQLSLGFVEPPTTSPTLFEDPDHYPGLTLKQPYAGLLLLAALGFDGKSIETREHAIAYRGPLVVIAGLGRDGEADDRFDLGWLHDRGIPLDAYQRATSLTGVAIALIDVAACRDLRPEDEHRACFYKPGRKAWLPSRMRRLVPFPARGLPGFSRVPRALVEPALQAAGVTERAFCPGCGKRDASPERPSDYDDPTRMTCLTDRFGTGCGRSWRACGCRALRRVVETKPMLVTEVWCERCPEGGECDCGCDACAFEPPLAPGLGALTVSGPA